MMSKRKCKMCFYRGNFGGSTTCCDYMLITGHRRGCPADACTKYTPANGKKPDRKILKDGTIYRRPYFTDKAREASKEKTQVLITLDGETHSLTEWAQIKGISKDTIYKRRQKGWNEREQIYGRRRAHPEEMEEHQEEDRT